MTRPGRSQCEILWDATLSLLALRWVEPHEVEIIKKTVAHSIDLRTTPLMKAILMDDRVTQARLLILRLGNARLGPALPEYEAALNSIDSLERLEQIADRLLEASSWKELLAP